MTEIVELLPCPFCGQQPSSQWWACHEASDDGYWGIDCPNTCAQSHEDNEETAVTKWNTRAAYEVMARSDEEVTERIDYLVKMARQYEAAVIRVPSAVHGAGERLEQAKRELRSTLHRKGTAT